MSEFHFSGEEHRRFFYDCLKRSGSTDLYHQALFYTLGVSPDTRCSIEELFDFEENRIRPEGLHADWQTGGTTRLTRLAFNLWNGYTEPGSERDSSPYWCFDCGFAPYMLEGIRLRYPEYCRDWVREDCR